MIRHAWIPTIVIILVPVVVSAFISQFGYYEYKKRMKEMRFKQTHKREILQLIAVENKNLIELEDGLTRSLYSLVSESKLQSHPELYNAVAPIYKDLSELKKNRSERLETSKIEPRQIGKIFEMTEDKLLKKLSKDYPEFMSILKIFEYIWDNPELDVYNKEHELLEEIMEISKPHMLTVTKSNTEIISLYNELVDIYNYFIKKHEDLDNKDKVISKIERGLMDKIKEIAKKAKILEIVQKDADFVYVYNGLVDLFNHYTKKQELSNKIKKGD